MDVCVEAAFPFTKLPNGFDGETYDEWASYGWDIESGDAIEAPIPTEFGLDGAYPNPFNPSTSIRVSLPETAHLAVNVYNVNGQLVAILADGTAPAGYHSFTFDATDLSSGVYFVQATANGLNAMQKVMLVK